MSRRRRIPVVCCAFVALALLPACPRYQIVHDQSPFSENGAESILGGYDYHQGNQTADSFYFYASGVLAIGRVEWWGEQSAEFLDEDYFIIRIYEDRSSAPREGPLYAVAVGTGNPRPTDTADVYEYSAEFTPLELTPGNKYYISIVCAEDRRWVWQISDSEFPAGSCWSRVGEYGAWTSSGADADMAFRLYQPMP